MRRFVAFSGGVSSPPGGFFLGWTLVDVLQAEALDALLLLQTAARRERIARFLCQTLI